MLVYWSAACCKKVPKKRETPIKIKYLINNFEFFSISFLILFFSIKIAKGSIVKKPTKNLEELKSLIWKYLEMKI